MGPSTPPPATICSSTTMSRSTRRGRMAARFPSRDRSHPPASGSCTLCHSRRSDHEPRAADRFACYPLYGPAGGIVSAGGPLRLRAARACASSRRGSGSAEVWTSRKQKAWERGAIELARRVLCELHGSVAPNFQDYLALPDQHQRAVIARLSCLMVGES